MYWDTVGGGIISVRDGVRWIHEIRDEVLYVRGMEGGDAGTGIVLYRGRGGDVCAGGSLYELKGIRTMGAVAGPFCWGHRSRVADQEIGSMLFV